MQMRWKWNRLSVQGRDPRVRDDLRQFGQNRSVRLRLVGGHPRPEFERLEPAVGWRALAAETRQSQFGSVPPRAASVGFHGRQQVHQRAQHPFDGIVAPHPDQCHVSGDIRQLDRSVCVTLKGNAASSGWKSSTTLRMVDNFTCYNPKFRPQRNVCTELGNWNSMTVRRLVRHDVVPLTSFLFVSFSAPRCDRYSCQVLPNTSSSSHTHFMFLFPAASSSLHLIDLPSLSQSATHAHAPPRVGWSWWFLAETNEIRYIHIVSFPYIS